jgi:hypothetical protein
MTRFFRLVPMSLFGMAFLGLLLGIWHNRTGTCALLGALVAPMIGTPTVLSLLTLWVHYRFRHGKKEPTK